MAAIFLAQATNTDLTLSQQLGIIAILLLTSREPPESGFRLHRAAAALVGDPLASIALILGIDRFMSEARAHQPDRQRRCDRGCREVEGRSTKASPPRSDQETDLEADEPETVKVEDDVVEAGGPQPIPP